jgi:hypothetical protein
MQATIIKKIFNRIKKEFCNPQRIIFWGLLIIILGLIFIYRWYQPLTQRTLLQFDVFDWARQSREWLLFGHILTPTTLWVFPIWNAIVSKITGVDLFYIYLYSGAFLTTLNIVIIYGISSKLWRQPVLRLMPLLFYAFNTQLLARSVNYLPETMSYTFGLALLYLYLRLVYDRKPLWLVPICIINYLYYHLHQSGTNFLVFTVVVVILYICFVTRQTWKKKIVWLAVFLLAGIGFIISNVGIRQQIAFFLNGSKNADIAFQGTAIPFKQITTDYPFVFYTLLILGILSILIYLIRYREGQRNVAWITIMLITGFYFMFLYVLPNLKLYSLVPWRFYTWFSLYAIFIVSEGFALLFRTFRRKIVLVNILIPSFIIVNLIHGNLISDNMYTANAATLHSMENLNLPSNSRVITTNANYLQTKYALVKKSNVITTQAGAELFKVPSSNAANAFIASNYSDKSVYILISLYQLQQRPSNIAYWANSAIYDMDLSIFSDSRYFTTVYRDQQIVVFRSLEKPTKK